MNKRNRKLKILYKCIKANTSAIIMAAYAAHTTNYSTHSLLATQTKQKTRATQKILPFGKWRFKENEVRRMGQKQKLIRQKERQDFAEEKREEIYIEKWDKTDSPERFQTGGRHQKSPGLPSGCLQATTAF